MRGPHHFFGVHDRGKALTQPRGRGRFLFAMWEGGGTAPPELAVASRLVSRGHEVVVLGNPSLAADVASAGARFVAWKDAPHRATRTRESEIVRDWAALTALGAFARARDRHAFAPARLFAREVVEAFRAWPADVVACDAMLFGALVGAEAARAEHGARVVALLPMTSFLPAPGRPPAALGLGPARGALGRARDRLLETAGDALLWRSCVPYFEPRAARGRARAGRAPARADSTSRLRARSDERVVRLRRAGDRRQRALRRARARGPRVGARRAERDVRRARRVQHDVHGSGGAPRARRARARRPARARPRHHRPVDSSRARFARRRTSRSAHRRRTPRSFRERRWSSRTAGTGRSSARSRTACRSCACRWGATRATTPRARRRSAPA